MHKIKDRIELDGKVLKKGDYLEMPAKLKVKMHNLMYEEMERIRLDRTLDEAQTESAENHVHDIIIFISNHIKSV